MSSPAKSIIRNFSTLLYRKASPPGIGGGGSAGCRSLRKQVILAVHRLQCPQPGADQDEAGGRTGGERHDPAGITDHQAIDRIIDHSFSPEGKVYRRLAGARGFLPQRALPPPIFVAIDIAPRPAIYYRHGYKGRFIVQSGNSARSEKANSGLAPPQAFALCPPVSTHLRR